jgi:hypothetical protein
MAGGHEERDQLEDPEADGRVTLWVNWEVGKKAQDRVWRHSSYLPIYTLRLEYYLQTTEYIETIQ